MFAVFRRAIVNDGQRIGVGRHAGRESQEAIGRNEVTARSRGGRAGVEIREVHAHRRVGRPAAQRVEGDHVRVLINGDGIRPETHRAGVVIGDGGDVRAEGEGRIRQAAQNEAEGFVAFLQGIIRDGERDGVGGHAWREGQCTVR